MSSRWLISALLTLGLSTGVSAQQHIQGFVREFAIQGLPAPFSLKSFDVNGDSVSDLLIVKSNRLLVFDGKTFTLLFQDSTTPGTANLNPADVNRDGVIDLVATSKDTAVVVWYGPDFQSRRVYLVRSGFISFAARNREDAQVEFSFAFKHTHIFCPPPPSFCNDTTEGHILRFIDTTLTFFDSVHVDLNPTTLSWERTSPGQYNLLLIGYYIFNHYYNGIPGDGPGRLTKFKVERMEGQQVSTLLSYFAVDDYESHCGLIPILRAYSIGNIDTDTANELVAFANPTTTFPGCHSTPFFGIYDILTGIQQWGRTDLPGIISLFTIDLNGDGVQELLSYEIQSGKPGLVEYQTTNGATLGFTELSFAPTTLSAGLFGDPVKPKVLLAHADSVVVFRVVTDCSEVKGDMDSDGNLTIFDVVLELNCAFLGTGYCDFCYADVNCDGILTAADVVLELNAVFLQTPLPCS